MFALSGNILVIDEGAGFCRNLAAKLAGRGYRADFAFDIHSAENKIVSGQIDLVALSCAGKTSCKEMIEQIQKVRSDAHVITFEVPDGERKCGITETDGIRIVSLNAWDVQEATQYVCECLEDVMKKAGDATLGNQLLFGQGKQVDIQVLGVHQTSSITSVVLRRDDRFMYLSDIKDSAGRSVDIPIKASIKVGVAGNDALYSFTSQVVDILQESDTVLQIGKPVVIYRTQRRKHSRFPMKLPVRMAAYCDESENEPTCFNAVTEDISKEGLKIVVPEYVEPGEVIMVDLYNESKNHSVSGLAYVLRTTLNPAPEEGGYIVACRFSRVDADIEALLQSE